MNSLKILAFAVIAIVFQTAAVTGTNLNTCLASVQNGTYGIGVDIGGTDNRGRPVNVSVATALTYRLCIEACGGGPEPFQWSVFSTQFGSFLLPWLALVSQIPFGNNDKVDNLQTVLLTVGSPTLAAYSLALTVMNGRWIARRFAQHTCPNVRNAIHILSSLQQTPISVVRDGRLLASLIVLPENDGWWSALSERLDYTHTWSIAAVTSIAWVVISYTFTLISSFSNITGSLNSNGQSVGSLWLWLLPINIGWLQISPKCDSARLRDAVECANKLAYVATDEGNIVLAGKRGEARAIVHTLREVNCLHRDEKRTSPVFNYSRFLSWVQAVEDMHEGFKAASNRSDNHESVDPINWVTVKTGQELRERNRRGNRAQVEGFCTPQLTTESRSRWGPEVASRMFIASLLALILQWGTTFAAVIVVWYTPTQGLGCRSAMYLLYAALSTITWMLLVASSILTHYAAMSPRHSKGRPIRNWSTRAATMVSIGFRRLGKLIAAFNTLGVVVLCLFQLGSVLDNCYCNSSVFGLRDHAYILIELVHEDIMGIKAAWYGGLCLAVGTGVIYVGFVNVFIESPSGRSDVTAAT